MILSAILILCLLVGTAACGGEQATLPAPAYLYLNDNDELVWSEVDGARTYEVEIDGGTENAAVRSVRRANCSLETLKEGDHTLRVRALGAEGIASPWSEPYTFKKEADSGFIFKAVSDNTAWTLASARSTSGEVIVPDTYRGKPIVETAAGAFRNNQETTSVTLGRYLTTIADRTFYNCVNLKTVLLSDDVSFLGEAAFSGCTSLDTVTPYDPAAEVLSPVSGTVSLPSNLTAISDLLFTNCTALTKLVIPEGVTSIGDSAFYYCAALTSAEIPDSVESIGEYAFSNAQGMTSVKIGAGLKRTADYVFSYDKNLTSVTFAEHYDDLRLGAYAFAECDALEGLAFPDGTTVIPEGCFFGDDALDADKIVIPDSVTEVNYGAFLSTPIIPLTEENADVGWIYVDGWLVYVSENERNALKEITPDTLAEGTVGIADEVFFSDSEVGCTDLQSVTLKSSVKYLGSYAFAGCQKLTTFIVENASELEVIGQRAFYGCAALYILQLTPTIGRSQLRSIENRAFYGCLSLSYNYVKRENLIPDSVTHVGQRVFDHTNLYESATDVVYAGRWVVGCKGEPAEITLQLPAQGIESRPEELAVVGIADYAFGSQMSLEVIDGLARVQYLGIGAFYDCEALATGVTLNHSLTSIADYVFAQCVSLRNVDFPRTLTSIGNRAFFQCDVLAEIDLEDTQIQTIDEYAFYSCEKARVVTLPEGLERIGPYAFYHCGAAELTIPSTVTAIEDHAFTKSENLTKLTFAEGEEGSKLREIGDYAFRYSPRLEGLDLPDSLKKIGTAAFLTSGVKYVNFGSGIEEIGSYAFGGDSYLAAVTLPEGLRIIGDDAFFSCAALTSVVLPASLTSIGSYAFYNCPNVAFYTALEAQPSTWNERWNATYRPVAWGATISREGYVEAIETGKLFGAMVRGGLGAPTREGYVFLGWATEPNGAELLSMAQLRALTENTMLYAVYGPAPIEPETPSGPDAATDETVS